MKKKDLFPILLILALFLAYPTIDRKVMTKIFPPKARPAPAAVDNAKAPDIPAETALAEPEAAGQATGEPAAAAETAEVEPASAEEQAPEVLSSLKNDRIELTLSSHGAGIVRCALVARRDGKLQYPASKGSDQPVAFDFSDRPAAAPVGYPGLGQRAAFEVVAATDNAVAYRKTLDNGLVIDRKLTLGAGYQVQIEDRIQNSSAAPVALRNYGLQAGFMENLPGEAAGQQGPLLGVDTLTGSEAVQYWGPKFEKWFPVGGDGKSVALPGSGEEPIPVDWAAVKNKYFTQVLAPAEGAERCFVNAARGQPVQTTFMLFFPRTTVPIGRVAARVEMPDYDLAPGQALAQNATFYLGPKVYAELKANGPHQEDILQLGFWRVIGIWILKIMVWIHDHVWPFNYGVAIILLTFLIRIVFWPLNHKSMASTRHMQEIQPLITAVREKYKDSPQKQQQEMMALYKEHKINPMGGCLPMLIQIPVFFALFVVLRGAIELRFSSFLWIADLSTPENLFKNVLPFPINILPLFMGVTMWVQQKMTPTSDPQQQKMMMMMPVLFTFMFYSFPSGLSLYWSVNQVMMIFQLAWMKKFHHAPLAKK